MPSLTPFGERSLTIVAARFDDCGSAERAASAVRGVLQDTAEVHVVGPAQDFENLSLSALPLTAAPRLVNVPL